MEQAGRGAGVQTIPADRRELELLSGRQTSGKTKKKTKEKFMRIMKSKQQEIRVVGEWTGGEDEVTRWLTDNGYVWKIQTENAAQWTKRLAEMEGWTEEEKAEYSDRRVRLNVLGDGIYEQWSCEPGSVLVLRKGSKLHDESEDTLVLTVYDADRISEGFEDA